MPIKRRAGFLRSGLRGLARGAGGAALAGLGWRLGVDAYEAIKKWVTEPPILEDDEYEDDFDPPSKRR